MSKGGGRPAAGVLSNWVVFWVCWGRMGGPPHQFFIGQAQGRELVRGFASLKRGICGLEVVNGRMSN